MTRQKSSKKSRKLIREINDKLHYICTEYLTGVNSVSYCYIDDSIDLPEEADLGELIEDSSTVVRDHIECFLAECAINEDKVLAELGERYSEQMKDVDPIMLPQEILIEHISQMINDLIRESDAQMYKMSKKAFKKYLPDGYIIYFEVAGYLHFRQPVDCWGVLFSQWFD